MIFIFEGPDLIGKSTLASKVAEKLNSQLFVKINTKNYYPDNWDKYQNFYTLTSLDSFLQWPKESNLIVDRLWLSAIVYSNVYERKDNLDYIKPYDYPFANIFVYADFEKIKYRIKERHEDEIILKKLEKIYDEYNRQYDIYKNLPNSIFVDGSLPIEQNLKIITEWISSNEF